MADIKKQKDYSETVKLAEERLNNHLSTKPGEYKSNWQNALNDTINKIQNREEFNYDLNGDALYQQYKDQYTKQGQLAMQDTIGQAAAMTGGYGNSYAQSVGQQTFQGYLQNLNDMVPELYQIALDRHNQETQDRYNQYGLYADREDTDYGRYRDSVSDFNTERDYLTGRLDTANQYEYQAGRDAVADKQWQDTFDEGVRQFNESTRIQQEQWQAEFDEKVKVNQQNYDNEVARIKEDIRHNKITEEQGQKDLEIAQNNYNARMAELKEDKRQYDLARKDAGYVDETLDYDSIVDDLNLYISKGAEKSEIGTYLRNAYKSGYITESEYKKLKEQFAPKGQTY